MSSRGWDEMDLEKAVDDPWTPADANAFPRKSEEAQATWEAGHDDDGHHKRPAAAAWARINWTGATYVIIAGEGVVSAVKDATGRVIITLDFNMANRDDWIGTANPIWSEPAGGYEDWVFASAGKTEKICRVQLVKAAAGAITAMDCSFTFRAYGDRA